MSSPLLLLVVVALVAGILGVGRSSRLRSISRGISLLGFLLFGGIAAASLYGSFALASRGGGVLLFLAIPTGLIAWLFFASLTASREAEELHHLPVGERAERSTALLDSQIRAHEQTVIALSERANSFWITPGKRRRLREEIAHSRFMINGLRQMRPAVADPANHTDGERPLP